MDVGLIVIVILLFIVVGVFIGFEKEEVNSKQVALISTLSAIAGLGRIPFAGIPSVQPTTFVVIISGYVFGWKTGFMIGGLAAGVSNFFLGHGPWTIWQMASWGLIGVAAGGLKKVIPNIGRLQLILFCGISGYLYGWLVNIWFWAGYIYPHTISSYIAVCVSSFWMDSLHAGFNAVLAGMFGKEFINILLRFKRRLKVEYL